MIARRELAIAAAEAYRLAAKRREFAGWKLKTQASRNRILLRATDPIFRQPIDLSMSLEDFRAKGRTVIRDFAKLPDIKIANAAPRKVRNPRLLDRVRATAEVYRWSFEMYRQVITMLWETRVIGDEEFDWLLDGGPLVHPYWKRYPVRTPSWRGLPDGSSEEQYTAYRRRARLARRRFLATDGKLQKARR